MYLSRLTLNLRNRRVQRELANRYELHRTVMNAFPEKLPEGERVLFRLEEARNRQAILLVQSKTMPDYSHLPSGYLLRDIEVKTYQPNLKTGQRLIFRLLANPTKKISLPEEGNEIAENAKRIGIVREEEQLKWLERKAEENGFRLIGVRSTPHPDIFGFQQQEGKTRRVTFHAVQFDGILEILDAESLFKAICSGIGSGKGFGFGLLSVAKID